MSILAALDLLGSMQFIVTGDKLVEMIERAQEEEVQVKILTTASAARRFGKSASWWRQEAEAGEIAGAWQDVEGGRWNLPASACVDMLARKQAQPQTDWSPRGPRAATASTE